jgi:hypothetical protein
MFTDLDIVHSHVFLMVVYISLQKNPSGFHYVHCLQEYLFNIGYTVHSSLQHDLVAGLARRLPQGLPVIPPAELVLAIRPDLVFADGANHSSEDPLVPQIIDQEPKFPVNFFGSKHPKEGSAAHARITEA